MIEFSEAKLFISPLYHEMLNKNAAAMYADILSQALEIFKEATGIEPVSPRPASLEWAILPIAWLIDYLTMQQIQTKPEQVIVDMSEFRYKEALRILRSRRVARPEGRRSVVGEIEGVIKI